MPTYRGPHDVEVLTVPDPTPRNLDGAVVKVTAAGLCGSDLHIYDGHGFTADIGFSVGHEAIGEVIEVGSGVRRFSVGDRVLVPASAGCGRCDQCRTGWVLGCDLHEAGVYGIGHALQGSQAEALSVPGADVNLVAIPEGIGDDAAVTLTDNLPTAWYGLRRARTRPGDSVAVIGLGPVGILSVLAAQTMGAARVLALDVVPERRARAAALGAQPVEVPDAPEAVMEMTGGRGVDVVIEAVGADATIDLSLELAATGGRVSVIGVSQNMAFPMRMLLAQLKELQLTIGACSVQRELPALLELVRSGRIHPEVAVTHHLPLSEGPEGYRIFSGRLDGVGKVIFDPSR